MNVFSCKRCGHCCTGSGGIILDQMDLDCLCQGLQQSEAEFIASSAVMRNGKLQIKSADGACIFFGSTGCQIHAWRPNVCRAWPYFYGNLVDETSYQLAKQDCPGLNPETTHAQFIAAGQKYLSDLQIINSSANALRPLTSPKVEKS